MYPVIFTAALFIGIILNDVISKNSETETLKHLFIGLVATLGMGYLSYKGLNIVGWAILIVPMLTLLISYIILLFNPTTPAPVPEPAPAKKPARPILNLPDPHDVNSVCIEYTSPPKVPKAPQCTMLADGTLAPPPACPSSEPAPVNPSPVAPAAPKPPAAPSPAAPPAAPAKPPTSGTSTSGTSTTGTANRTLTPSLDCI